MNSLAIKKNLVRDTQGLNGLGNLSVSATLVNRLANKFKILSSLTVCMLPSISQGQIKINEFSLDRLSPSQRYEMNTGAAVAVSSGSFDSSFDEDSNSLDLDGDLRIISVAGHLKVNNNLFLGIRGDSAEFKGDIDNESTSLSPYLGVRLFDNLIISYELNKEDDDLNEYDQHSLSALYANESAQVGVVTNSQVQDKGIPASYLIHSRFQVTDKSTFGLAVSTIENSGTYSPPEWVVNLGFLFGQGWELELLQTINAGGGLEEYASGVALFKTIGQSTLVGLNYNTITRDDRDGGLKSEVQAFGLTVGFEI